MKIRKVAVGNAAEAFIEGNFTNGVNIISSDDNNKGIVYLLVRVNGSIRLTNFAL